MPVLRAQIILAAAAVALGAAVSSCNAASAEDRRLDKVEKSLAGVTGVAETIEGRIDGLETEGKALGDDITAMRASLDELKAAIASLEDEITALRESDTSIGKRLDDLTTKLNAIDQRLWLLESRYNDHLRKYHSG